MTHIPELAVGTVCFIACVSDIRAHRISNLLTFGFAGLAILFHVITGGVGGLEASVAGWSVGAALFFPLFALGGMGAGDVKLLAAVGAWLGPGPAAWTALYAAVAGAVMAVAVALLRGYLHTALSNLGLLFTSWWLAGIKPIPELTLEASSGPRLAYALPITVGTVVTLWLH